MPSAYFELAAKRVSSAPDGYMQPEQFGYDFRSWVSPYTKGACKPGSIALVLQDWASEDGLRGGPNPRIAELGRDPCKRTNKVLEDLLHRFFGVSLKDVYATNAFPFVKPGAMAAPIPQHLVNETVRQFARRELELAAPSRILALGRVAHQALQSSGVPCIHVPHPAARIGNLAAHERAWCAALGQNSRSNDS